MVTTSNEDTVRIWALLTLRQNSEVWGEGWWLPHSCSWESVLWDVSRSVYIWAFTWLPLTGTPFSLLSSHLNPTQLWGTWFQSRSRQKSFLALISLPFLWACRACVVWLCAQSLFSLGPQRLAGFRCVNVFFSWNSKLPGDRTYFFTSTVLIIVWRAS